MKFKITFRWPYQPAFLGDISLGNAAEGEILPLAGGCHSKKIVAAG